MSDLYVYDGDTEKRLASLTVGGDGHVTGDPAEFGTLAGQIAGDTPSRDAALAALDGWSNGYLLIASEADLSWADRASPPKAPAVGP